MSGAASPADYEIRVEGVLDQRWTAWFEGLEIDSDQNQTVIWGPVADQAALHGLLNRVCDLGLGKLGAANRTEAVARGRELGLID